MVYVVRCVLHNSFNLIQIKLFHNLFFFFLNVMIDFLIIIKFLICNVQQQINILIHRYNNHYKLDELLLNYAIIYKLLLIFNNLIT